jgi:hypothetical protein
VSSPAPDDAALTAVLARAGWPAREAERLAHLARLLANRPPPPDPIGLYPRAAPLQAQLRTCLAKGDGERIEEALLELYAHLHGHDAPYTPEERARRRATGGYWCHAGGLSPILKAPDYLHPDSASIDLGAGNGLQLLLVQCLAPHRLSVQVEIAGRMLDSGRALQKWLGIPGERVRWVHGDVLEAEISGYDLVYLYRPVKPAGPGRGFYQRLARQLASTPRPVVVLSIADCLGEFLPPTVQRFYCDGQLTCYRTAGGGGAPCHEEEQ